MFALASRAVVLVFLFAFSTTFAQTVEWWDDTASSNWASLATPQGVYAVGQFGEPGPCPSMGSLVKFTSDGVVEWQRVADLGCASAFGSVAADDDAVYVHGGMQVERNDNFVTVTFVRAYTHDGTALWTYEDTVGGPEGFLENLSITDRSIAVDENGVYALSQTGAQALVRRFDFNGGTRLVPVNRLVLVANRR